MSEMLDKNIQDVSIEDTLKNSYLDYAMSVIAGRALPDVRDGLKPVHRRVLYTMNEMGVQYNKPNKKSARIVGDTMGKLHPHGDSAIYDALVRLAQDFSMRYPLVIGQGNFGSIDGDSAAASRYTEARMARISDELMADIDCDTVDFMPNYDGSMTEPTVFPTKIPNLLINGISGIAVGMATNIPPHNLTEIMDGLLYMIDEENYTEEGLFNIIKGPDFPTSGIIMGKGDIINAYKTGRASIRIRARADIIEVKGGKEQIVITEIPYQVNKSVLVEKIAELVNEKKIPGITDIRDVSSMKGIKILIDIKKGESAEVILNRLYKFTALESSFGFNMVALVGGRPQLLTLENILTEFLNHRIEVVTRRTRYKLMKAEERMHIVEGLRIAVQNIDEVVKIIKESKDTQSAKKALMDRFDLSEIQSQAILDMRLAKITGLEIDKLNEEYEQLKKDIEYYNSILNSKSKLISVIRQEIVDIKTRYGDERKTEIADSVDDINYEDLIPNDEMVVTITHNGYVKRTLLNNFTAQKRGGKGKIGAANKNEDFLEEIIYTTNKSHLFIFTTKGKVHFLKVYQIPEQSRDSKGRHISNLLTLDENEKIASFLTLPEKDETKSIFFATKFGVVKRVKTIEFKSGRSGIIALNLKDNDEIVTTLLTGDNDKIFLATRDGKTIQFSVEDVRPMGRTATGVRGILLERDDVVVSAEVVEEDSPLLAVTSLGYGKGTDKDEYRMQSRGGKGLKLMKLTSKTGLVVGVRHIHQDEDDIMLITKNGKTIRIAASEVSVIGRNTQGTRLMNTSDDEIVSFTVVPKDDSDNEEMQGEDNGSNS
ncbi:DNA gyrase subunit A [Mucispirillum schaedleri]|jgi:DNA gyrase subunit A|uniref:DNA gyrase subunit A n=1 Tax=Mucispirillum schaedleri ASF457 TaxID=1379858 RepID=V2QDI8_9BACT|nr:DNA gyrase subunit A [Mucispirillum schaedleri]MCX4361276.1 DNA gyrase subunit A [Mucispirillum schaedleri]USF24257.1 DNA gyrase subunit A [Mucispirillum schaedleri ASF457]SIW06012.1 DNA gyrase subunit A [Mucispirillum schaedleri ASF457]